MSTRQSTRPSKPSAKAIAAHEAAADAVVERKTGGTGNSNSRARTRASRKTRSEDPGVASTEAKSTGDQDRDEALKDIGYVDQESDAQISTGKKKKWVY